MFTRRMPRDALVLLMPRKYRDNCNAKIKDRNSRCNSCFLVIVKGRPVATAHAIIAMEAMLNRRNADVKTPTPVRVSLIATALNPNKEHINTAKTAEKKERFWLISLL